MVTLLVTAAALVFSFLQTPVYEAEARLLVTRPIGSADDAGPVNLQTESQLVASAPVASLVRRELRLTTSTHSLLARLQVKPVDETAEVLSISYSSSDPVLARDAANSFASNYMRYTRERAQESLAQATQDVQRQIDGARRRLTTLATEIEAARRKGEASLGSALETERSVVIARIGVLQQRLEDIDPYGGAFPATSQLIAPARTQSEPASPNHLKNGLTAAVLGIALGIAFALLRERLDDRFADQAAVERALGAPVLATIPTFRAGKVKGSQLISLTDPTDPASEAYRTLRTSLQFIASQEGLRSIVVTSPAIGEGKTAMSANLAVALARVGQRVVLVSADLRRPTLERYFGIPNEVGLSSWLSSNHLDLTSLIRKTGVPNVFVLASGPIPPNPAELLTAPRLTDLVRELEDRYDVVIFDSPPTLAVADAATIASRVGSALMVINASDSKRSAAIHAKAALERVGADIIGAVLNALDRKMSPYGYEGYASEWQPQRQNGNGAVIGAPTRRSGILGLRK